MQHIFDIRILRNFTIYINSYRKLALFLLKLLVHTDILYLFVDR